MNEWEVYEPGDSDEYIKPEQWGKDHWSTLLYAESIAVNHGGKIDNRRMRTNARLHRHFANLAPITGQIVDGSSYPTRLADGENADNHDDWSCLEDAAAAGYVILCFRRASTAGAKVFGDMEARVELTDLGFDIAHAVRKLAARGTPASKVRLPKLFYLPKRETLWARIGKGLRQVLRRSATAA